MVVDLRRMNRAEIAIRAADKKLAQLLFMQSTEDVHQAWGEFLIQINRAYDQLRKGTGTGKTQQWSARLVKDAKEDQLIHYVLQARNTDEHGLDPVIRHDPSRMTIGAKDGRITHIRHVAITPAGVFMHPADVDKLRIEMFAGETTLLPFDSRGVIYPVPTSHLGQPFALPTLEAVARAAVAFFDKRFKEAQGLAASP